jgi:hypothetical protein
MTSANGEPSTFSISLTRSEPAPVTVPRVDLAERCAEDARPEDHRDRHLQSIASCDGDVLAQTQTSDHTMARSRSAVSCTHTSDATGPAAERRRDEFAKRTAIGPRNRRYALRIKRLRTFLERLPGGHRPPTGPMTNAETTEAEELRQETLVKDSERIKREQEEQRPS